MNNFHVKRCRLFSSTDSYKHSTKKDFPVSYTANIVGVMDIIVSNELFSRYN